MTNYIINPMWFYWISVFECAKLVSVIAAVLFAAYGCTVIVFWDDCLTKRPSAKRITMLFVGTVVSVLLAIFIPSKETLISMMVAKFATYENAQWTADAIKSTVDYIIEAFKTIG